MIHNHWAKTGVNAKLFYQVFRGLCTMRIRFADKKSNEYIALCVANHGEFREMARKKANFWLHVMSYWSWKRREAQQWEKDYAGSAGTTEQFKPAKKTV